MSAAINTAKVAGRRTLRFDTLDAVAADVETLAAAREVKALGNWTPGQILKHLALVMHSQIDGMPNRMPWYVRAMLVVMRPIFLKKMLRDGMSAGFRLPSDVEAIVVPSSTTTWDEGLAAIRKAIQMLKTETKREPSPFMGNLSLADSNLLQCRHSELHLSFLVPIT